MPVDVVRVVGVDPVDPPPHDSSWAIVHNPGPGNVDLDGVNRSLHVGASVSVPQSMLDAALAARLTFVRWA